MLTARRFLVAISLALVFTIAQIAPPAYAEDPPSTAPTFTIFATRQGLVGRRTANGHRIQPRDRFVALPSMRVLSSRNGNEFQVRVTYGDRSVVLPVWDVGPWNTHDEYWNPQRSRYSDLPQGLPMAQAAHENGYNGGRDEFGRRVRDPNGIDIADGAFWDDLGMQNSDWVQVTFLWLGTDPGGPVQAASLPVEQAGPEIEADAIVVDDGTPAYSAQAEVRWYSEDCGMGRQHSWTYGTPDPEEQENYARWTPALPAPGFYEVLAYIPPCGRTATRSARYNVIRDGGVTERIVDQAASAGTWASLGVYHMGTEPPAVELNDLTGDDGQSVRFDAIKWVPRADMAPPDARVTDAALQPDGAFLITWGGQDDTSGIASYDVQVRKLPRGGWTNWQSGVTIAATGFTPPGPGKYGFRARARDWAGHTQAWRKSDDLTIQVNK